MEILPRLITLALLGLTISIEPSRAADAKFECPRDFRPSDPAKLNEIRLLLPTGNAIDGSNRLNAMIDKLRRDGMSEALIVDHLVGAYCRMAQDASLSVIEKNARARRFEAKITALLRQPEDSNRMIIDVPLKPGVVAAAVSAARRDGLSVDGWISRAVEFQLQQKYLDANPALYQRGTLCQIT